MNDKKRVVICIPGLGGHESCFKEYPTLLSDYDLRFVRLIDHRKCLEDIVSICEREERVTFLCNCYGIQLALRAAERAPKKVERIVVIESFFAEFHFWRPIALAMNTLVLVLLRFFGRIGFKRNSYNTDIDYSKLGKYPVYIQPVFDMQWQNLFDYFSKTKDILTYRLPKKVETPTLFILSPRGWMRNAKDRVVVRSIFTNCRMVEVSANSHDIVLCAPKEVAKAAHSWLESSSV